jgi:hypothetical protein
MLVLIDESGCPGFKLTKGSTPYFVVAMVIFTDFSEAERASTAIAELRNKLHIYPEFKFSKTRPEIKDAFFEALCKFNFKVHALIVKKNIIYNVHLPETAESFYNHFVQALIHHNSSILNNASIKIDGSGDKEFTKTLNAYLRHQTGQHRINKIKFADSKRNNLIQLADMIAGAIARSNNPNRNNATRWLQMLRKAGKIEDILVL